MAKTNRPLTQKEIRAIKGKGIKREKVTIENISKQMIGITIKHGKGQDFFLHSRTIWIHPRKSTTVWKDRLYDTQISGLRKKRVITTYGDTEKVTDLETDGKIKRRTPKVEPKSKEPVGEIKDQVVKTTKKKKSTPKKTTTESSEQQEEDTNTPDHS